MHLEFPTIKRAYIHAARLTCPETTSQPMSPSGTTEGGPLKAKDFDTTVKTMVRDLTDLTIRPRVVSEIHEKMLPKVRREQEATVEWQTNGMWQGGVLNNLPFTKAILNGMLDRLGPPMIPGFEEERRLVGVMRNEYPDLPEADRQFSVRLYLSLFVVGSAKDPLKIMREQYPSWTDEKRLERLVTFAVTLIWASCVWASSECESSEAEKS